MRTTVLTAYQKHVKKFAETYKGKNLMKAAAKTWNKTTGATKKKPQKSSPKKKGGKTVTNKKGKGNRILGSYSIKGLLLGSGVLAASKIAIPQAGAYGTGGALAVAGAAAKFLDLPGKALLPVGVMVFASEYILGMIGGGRGSGNSGGTDY